MQVLVVRSASGGSGHECGKETPGERPTLTSALLPLGHMTGIKANSEMLDNLLQFMKRLLWGWESRSLLLYQRFEPLMSLALLHVSFTVPRTTAKEGCSVKTKNQG